MWKGEEPDLLLQAGWILTFVGRWNGAKQGHHAHRDKKLRNGSTLQPFRKKNTFLSDYNSKGLSVHQHKMSQIPKGIFLLHIMTNYQ